MSGAPSKMPKGIQFVKSSETLRPVSAGSEKSVSQQSSFSHPPSLLSLPQQSIRNNGGRNNFPAQPQFGGPAANFSLNLNSNNPKFGFGMTPRYSQAFVKSDESYSSIKSDQNTSNGYQMPRSTNLSKSKGFAPPIQKTMTAKPICSNAEYLKAWKEEQDPLLAKIRKLAHEIVTLKTDRPNAMDKLHSAANRVPIRIEFNTEPIMGAKNSRSFLCYVFIEKVNIASGRGSKIKSAKAEAYEIALQKILMPYMRIVPVDPTTKEIEVSETPFTAPPREPSKFPLQKNSSKVCQHKESNLEAAGLKRRYNEYKNLDEFVIVEPKVMIPDCTAAHTLRRSADFNHMLLEYEYFFQGESARCILKIENEVLADVNGVSKMAAKNTASAQALTRLKKFCWIIKTKQAVDSDSRISKDEIFNELNEQSESIANDNIGNQMLRKMGWSGGGVGKDGGGIAEPVSLKSVLNREGLGLGASKGITDDLRKRIREVIENYASSDNQEDLVFSHEFRLEERQIIHDECRRLNLRSKSRGKGEKRYLCVRRKRSVNQLFDHLMSVGGETTRYQLVPPGCDTTSTNSDTSTATAMSSFHLQNKPGASAFINSSQPLIQNHSSSNGMTQNPSSSNEKAPTSLSNCNFQFGRNASHGNQFSASGSSGMPWGQNDGGVSGNGQRGFGVNGQQGNFHNPSNIHCNNPAPQNSYSNSPGRRDGPPSGWNNQARGYGNNGQVQARGYGSSGQAQARGYVNSGYGQGYGANTAQFNQGYGGMYNNQNQSYGNIQGGMNGGERYQSYEQQRNFGPRGGFHQRRYN